MYDFGSVNSHSNYLHWGDQDYLASLGAFSIACWLIPRNNAAQQDAIFAKSTGNNGYYLRSDSAGANPQTIDFLKNDTTGWDIHKTSTTYTNGNVYSLVGAFDGSKVSWFKNGLADGTPAGTKIIASNDGNLVIGNDPSLNKGYACYLGHIVYWNKTLTQVDAQQFHSGVKLPEYSSILFWDTCLSLATSETPKIGSGNRTVGGAGLYSHDIDNYYTGYSRDGSLVYLFNPLGSSALFLPKEHATIAFEFEPEWDSDKNTGYKYLMCLRHNSDNLIVIYWNSTSLGCDWKYNGVDHISNISPLNWNAGDKLKIAIRWLDAGELGRVNAEGQLFVKVGSNDWQSAPAVQFTQELQEEALSFLYFGSHGGTIDEHNAADGYFRYSHFFPEAVPFEEIQGILGDIIWV